MFKRFLTIIVALSATITQAMDPIPAPGGQAFQWGQNLTGRAAALAVLTNTLQMDGDSSWAAALRNGGTILAWGNNTYGQTNTSSIAGATFMACGWTHGEYIHSGGRVSSWGGPVQNGYTTAEWDALQPISITTATKVACGDHWSAALLANGEVWAWGDNLTGPATGFVTSGVIDIWGTWYRLMCLHSDGTVTLHGIGGTTGFDATPPSGALVNINKIGTAQRGHYTIANDGTTYGWGWPGEDATYGIYSAAPNDLVAIVGGQRHSSAILLNGSVSSWGDNSLGQLNIPAGLTNAAALGRGRYFTSAIQVSGAGGGDPGGGTGAGEYYVAKTGSDSNPGTQAQPFLTIAKAYSVATSPGDTIIVSTGDYAESITTTAAGTSGNPITLSIAGDGDVTTRNVTVNHAWNKITGIIIEKVQTGQGAGVFVDTVAHNLVLQNLTIRNPPHLFRTNWVFNSTSNSIYSPTGSDWAAAGFEVGGKIRTGASSIAPYLFANMDRNYTILGITNDALYTTTALQVETNAAAMSMIYTSPDNHIGYRGIMLEYAGSTSATNLIARDIEIETMAIGLDLQGPGPVTLENIRVDSNPWAGIRSSANGLTLSNAFFTGRGFIYYSEYESESVPHDGTPDQYDFVQGYVRSDGITGSNVSLTQVWFQNIHNPFGQMAGSGSTPVYGTNWLLNKVVAVGVAKEWSGLARLHNLTVQNSTFYRVSFDNSGNGYVLNSATANAARAATNHVYIRNAFVDIGDHSSTNAEGFYNIDYTNGGTFDSNFVASAESMGWAGKAIFSESNGINGGDPLFVNARDPLGPDGLPFTADDGLRPLPDSPMTLLSAGALDPLEITPNIPVAHFSAVNAAGAGWRDGIYTDFDTTWTNVAPFLRTNFVRPYTTPEALGEVPVVVRFDARGSVSGDWYTNDWRGIKEFRWNFGDGSTVVYPMQGPVVEHTYLTAGTYDVVLEVMNFRTNTARYTKTYRILPESSFAGSVWYVSTNGTGTGTSWAAATNSIQGAYNAASAGDYIAVGPGNWDEQLDFTKAGLGASTRITMVGYGATSRVWHRLRTSYHTIENWRYAVTNSNPGVYIFQAADYCYVKNCLFDMPNKDLLNGAVHVVGSSSPSYAPSSQSMYGLISGCTFTNIQDPTIQLFGTLGYTVEKFRAFNTFGEGDFIRPRGQSNVIQDGMLYNISSGGTSGHADIMQLDNQSGDGFWFKDNVFQRVWVEGNTNDVNYSSSSAAIAQIESGATAGMFGQWTQYTNGMTIRNCVFKNIRGPISDSVDGLRVFNNLFYIAPSDTTALTSGGDPVYQITGLSRSGTVATATTAVPHLMSNNKVVNIVGANEANFNQTGVAINSVTANTFRYTVADTGATVASGSPYVVGDRGSSFGTDIRNNIFYYLNRGAGSSSSLPYYNAVSGSQAPGTSVTADYNLVTPARNSAAWLANGNEVNGINGADPLFIDAANDIYVLATNSPALSAGTDLSAIGGNQQFSDDFWGAYGSARTQWSMGPFDESTTITSTGDTTDPTIVITGPTSAPTYATANPAIIVSGTASDNAEVQAITGSYSGATTGTLSISGTTTWTAASVSLNVGVTTITTIATDTSGNAAQDVITVTVSVDATTGRGRVGAYLMAPAE